MTPALVTVIDILPSERGGAAKVPEGWKLAPRRRALSLWRRQRWRKARVNAPEHASNALSATPGPRAKQRRYARRSQLLKLYGLTVEQYHSLLKKQDGLCAICGHPPKKESGPGSSLHVDHDHKTGKVRGLLCVRCNGSSRWWRTHASLPQRGTT